MTIKEFFSFKENKYFWKNIIAMAVITAILIFLVLKGLDIYTRHGNSVAVPNIKGMTVREAEMFLRNRGLACEVVDSGYAKDKPSGCILEQNPANGQNVKDGRVIYLTINALDVPLRTVPDVADNSSVRQAQAKLMSAGFELTANEPVTGEKDWVYGVKYEGRQLAIGDKVPSGATLTLMVGNGTYPVEIEDSTDVSSDEGTEPAEATPTDDSWF